MKKIIVLLLVIGIGISSKSFAQEAEIEQLLLNVEKLAQLRQILSDMKKGYEIVSTGYTTIKNLSEGNFHLHQTFLDGLLQVSPAVRKYHKVVGTVRCQLQLVKEYKSAYSRFRKDGNFNADEFDYLSNVYTNLFQESVKNLDAMAMVLTAHQLRMSDEERLKAIDAIFQSMQEKLLFLRHFNNNTTILVVQRAREKKDARTVQKLYGLTQ